MQLLILAAGMGKRLAALTENATKCMVPVLGKTLIHRTLDIATSYPLKRIILVVGYKEEVLRSHVGDEYAGVPVVYVTNPIYDQTNNIYSMALAQSLVEEDDTILVESDLIFTPSVFDKIYRSTADCAVMLDKYADWMDGTVTQLNSCVNNNLHMGGGILGFINKSNFDQTQVDTYYKTVNIYRFSKNFSTKYYFPYLRAYCSSHGLNEYYEAVLQLLCWVAPETLTPCLLSQEDLWYEIDNPDDLANATRLFSSEASLHS